MQKIESLYFYTIFSLIIFVLTYNLFHYDPIQGYDGMAHHAYVQNFLNIFVPGKTDQPSVNFTYEFFSPPLPYVLPAFINELCKLSISSANKLEICQDLYGFINILFLSVLFILCLVIYMKIIKILFNKDKTLNLTILLTIGIFSTNYKAISMIRGEVYILFLNACLIYKFLLLAKNSFDYKKQDIFIFGIIIGLLSLSRQWAFLLFPSFFLIYFFIEKIYREKYIKFMLFSFFLGFLISGWFYIGLFLEYGSFTTFNQSPTKFKLSNQPMEFYLPFANDAHMVFTKPIRPYFRNQFLPILYSDLWGDYWGYFSFTSKSLLTGRNQANIGDYLARVNLVSLIPTFLLFFGFKESIKSFKNKHTDKSNILNNYLVFAVLVSFFGYLWFLISFPNNSGDTNKATYIIHLFHLLGLCSAMYIEKFKNINVKVYFAILSVLFIVFIHNLSSMMSHFPIISIF
tara:strand:+ start:5493 stop:6866 length:1374 start_codon:yes stop_codon:yes gene_type:complete